MESNKIDFQPTLQNEHILAKPLQLQDFDLLYAAASDPLIWEQHPNKNRYQLEAFKNFFTGAMESGGAFLVLDASSGEVIGSSRYSDYDAAIGYTFFKRSHWGRGFNHALKTAMLNHVFPALKEVHFYVGATNKRSQVSIEKFGAIKIREEDMAYFGEPSQLNFVYCVTAGQWEALKS